MKKSVGCCVCSVKFDGDVLSRDVFVWFNSTYLSIYFTFDLYFGSIVLSQAHISIPQPFNPSHLFLHDHHCQISVHNDSLSITFNWTSRARQALLLDSTKAPQGVACVSIYSVSHSRIKTRSSLDRYYPRYKSLKQYQRTGAINHH